MRAENLEANTEENKAFNRDPEIETLSQDREAVLEGRVCRGGSGVTSVPGDGEC